MANRLKMARVQTIHTLLDRGWSYRRIARELGIHRGTVARYDRLRQGDAAKPAISTPGAGDPKPAISTPGTGDPRPAISTPGTGDPKPAISTPGTDGGRRSACEPHRAAIERMLEQGLSAQRIFQDLVAEHGFEAGYQSVKRFVRRLRGARPLPFRRMETSPGEEAQVDFGQGALVGTPGKKKARRRPHLFRIVLSHSRKAYSEVVWKQSTDDFIRCLENAFHAFGGAPKTLVVDNLKAAVTRADWYDPELNPKLESFARHYGTVVLPTKPRTPRHKGKVEAGVKYAQHNALRGRSFVTLEEHNRYLRSWEASVADHRIHGTTRRQVRAVFEETERPALLPLPVDRFPCFVEAERKVHRDGHVAVDNAFYSVPPEYLGRHLWVRWDSRLVRIFNRRMEQIAVHVRVDPGRFSTHSSHIADEKRSGVERGETWLLQRIAKIGPKSLRWSRALVDRRGVAAVRALHGFLALAKKHRASELEDACRVASSHGAYRLRTIRRLLRERCETSEQAAFLEDHPLIRDLGEYEELVGLLAAVPVPLPPNPLRERTGSA